MGAFNAREAHVPAHQAAGSRSSGRPRACMRIARTTLRRTEHDSRARRAHPRRRPPSHRASRTEPRRTRRTARAHGAEEGARGGPERLRASSCQWSAGCVRMLMVRCRARGYLRRWWRTWSWTSCCSRTRRSRGRTRSVRYAIRGASCAGGSIEHWLTVVVLWCRCNSGMLCALVHACRELRFAQCMSRGPRHRGRARRRCLTA